MLKTTFLLANLCLVFWAAGATEAKNGDNMIDKLVKEALEYIRTLMKEKEPFPISGIPDWNIQDKDISIKVAFNNVLVSNADTFTVDHIENNVLNLWAKFGVTVPTMHLTGGYTAQGTVKGEKVSGQGTFSLDINQLVTSGLVQVHVVDGSIQMEKMDIQYTVQDVKFSEEGLEIEGMTPDQVNDFLSKSFLQFCKDNEPWVSSQVGQYVMTQANQLMKGKTLAQLIEWLKKFIHG